MRAVEDPREAVSGADIIYTDVWTSMGQEEESAQRLKIFPPYQVNEDLVNRAAVDCLVMHCFRRRRTVCTPRRQSWRNYWPD